MCCDSHDVSYDVDVAPPRLSFAPVCDNLIFQLQTTTNRLMNAFNGVDVSWVDNSTLAVVYIMCRCIFCTRTVIQIGL